MLIQSLEKRLEALEAAAIDKEHKPVFDVHIIGMDGIVTKVLELKDGQCLVERPPTADELERSTKEARTFLQQRDQSDEMSVKQCAES